MRYHAHQEHRYELDTMNSCILNSSSVYRSSKTECYTDKDAAAMRAAGRIPALAVIGAPTTAVMAACAPTDRRNTARERTLTASSQRQEMINGMIDEQRGQIPTR